MTTTLKKTEIDITPHPSLIQKIGHTSFSVSEAISELIANSLSAVPSGKKADIRIDADLDHISVSDNGVGMSPEILIKAVTMAWPMQEYHPNPNTTKSVFGLGMKTACASLGNYWCIMSCTESSKTGYKIEFDLNSWQKRGTSKWNAELLEIDRDSIGLPKGFKSGTVVVIRKLKVKPILENLRKEIARSYLPHIKTGDSFLVGGEVLKEEPFSLLANSKVDVDIEVEGVKIRGWGALMSKGSLTNFGFHWYRKNQLIEAYDKSFVPNHPTSRQIIGELYADEMPVNFSKKGFEKESAAWKQGIEELREAFDKLLKEARKTKREQETNEFSKTQVNESLNILERVGSKLIEPDDDSEVSGMINKSAMDLVEAEISENVGKKISEMSERYPITIADVTVLWRHKFVHLEQDGPIVDYAIEGENEVLVLTNIDSPFADLFDDRYLLAVVNVGDAISRFLVEELKYEYTKAIAFKDHWLATSCAIIKERV